ncbi:MAG: hypothetical protein M3O67_06585 [Bacteroidota bacterium]|nr:hypothetical protein [Bacteroidota bacterium]
MEQLYPLVWIAFIVCVFLVWFFSHKAKHKERMMMIEKGRNVDELSKKEASFSFDELLRKEKSFRFPWLKLGVMVIGLSIGLLIIAVLARLNLLDKGGNALPLSILGICGGISLVIANYLNSGKSKQ